MQDRALKILEAIVDEYIISGEPIGSKLLAEKLSFSVSPATIRNDMAALEKAGLLEHPHTSAGRVPTFKGFKLYIETMMPKGSIPKDEQERIDGMFENIKGLSDDAIIENATRALADITKCAIVSTTSENEFSVITKVDVIPTGKRMYVLLLITSSGSIKNRVCRLSFDLSNEQMEFFQRFVNDNLKGVNLQNVSDEYVEKLSEALGNYMLTLSPLLKAVVDLSAEMLEHTVSMEGESNLLTCGEFGNNDIAHILESKNELTQLLDSSFSGINVIFSEESDSFVVSNSSFITGTFHKDGANAGHFGVIGPMRLDYKKIIPYIEYFTNKVTNLLSSEDEDEELKIIEKEAEQNEQG